MNPQYILVITVVVIMGWFAIGVLLNLRRGEAVLKWIQKGLPSIGQKTTFRWLGTSVAELVIAHAKKPFRRLETLLVLKPRDIFWMTILATFQGRSDIVIFRGQLTTAPVTDLELVDPNSWSGRATLKQISQRKWECKDYKEMQLWAPQGLLDLASSTLDRLTVPMQTLSSRYARFSLRRDASQSNFEVHVPFPQYRTEDAEEYFQSLRELAAAVNGRE